MTTSPASFADGGLAGRVAANLAVVRARIASTGRDPSEVRVVAVTKTFDVDHVRAAAAAGLDAVGENYVDELASKRAAAADLMVSWHYLGALQSNKIHRVVGCADVICGVSRAKELEKIAIHRSDQPIYVQVDFTGAAQRNGAAPRDVAALVERGRNLGLAVLGLMTVAPTDPSAARSAFQSTIALADQLGLVERSMGMSDDLELACELGSTEIRVGRALFGDRGAGVSP
jgi:uncharacterized pyridoxal phosphate-containing UPF0001 family protein